MKNKKKGFTLVELIVVLAILAILAAMLVPALTGYIDKANEKKIVATARQYAIAAQSVASDAYADNKTVTTIVVNAAIPDGKTVRTVVTTDDDEKYAKEFENLSELKSGDTAQFSFNASHSIVGNGNNSGNGATYVISGSLTAVMDTNGNWSLKK